MNAAAPAYVAPGVRTASALATPTFAVVAPPKRFDATSSDARWTVNSLLGRTGTAPKRSCVAHGGALHVIDDAGVLQVVERDGLILALASDFVTAAELLAAYDATATGNGDGVSDNDTRRRVNALRASLGDIHAKKGPFALALFDASLGRVLAARTANSVPISYGFTADSTLVACAGLSADNMFPEGSALELTHLPSGRFIFGHRYVKPIEFTQFWGTAAANRSAAPARKASDLTVKAAAALDTCIAVAADASAVEMSEAEVIDLDACKLARRWGNTGSVADGAGSWKRRGSKEFSDAKADVAPTFAPSAAFVSSTRATIRSAPATTLPLPTASKSAYVPPGMRAAPAAAAAEVDAAAAAEITAAAAAASGVASPRTAARNVAADAQVAAALASQEHIVTSLENALVSALELNLAKSASSTSNNKSAFTTAQKISTPASVADELASEWKSIRIPLSLRIPEEDLLSCSPHGAMSLEGGRRGGRGGASLDYGMRGPASTAAVSRLRSTTLDTASWEKALAVSRGTAGSVRRSMEACSRGSMELSSARGSLDVRGSMEVARTTGC